MKVFKVSKIHISQTAIQKLDAKIEGYFVGS
jgi:hypothetical protein